MDEHQEKRIIFPKEAYLFCLGDMRAREITEHIYFINEAVRLSRAKTLHAVQPFKTLRAHYSPDAVAFQNMEVALSRVEERPFDLRALEGAENMNLDTIQHMSTRLSSNQSFGYLANGFWSQDPNTRSLSGLLEQKGFTVRVYKNMPFPDNV